MDHETKFFTTSGKINLAYQIALSNGLTSKLAIISHPLGRLAGSSTDHVVQSLRKYLLNVGFGVLIYDSRGSGESGGSGSFTSLPEADDFAELIEGILLPLFPKSGSVNTLICAGYSAGSLSCSQYTPDIQTTDKYNFKPIYILISFPLGVLFALTLINSSTFLAKLSANVKAQKVLAVYGNKDQFSSAAKLRNWSDEMKAIGENWRGREIMGVDHFWGEPAQKVELLEVIGNWLSELDLQ